MGLTVHPGDKIDRVLIFRREDKLRFAARCIDDGLGLKIDVFQVKNYTNGGFFFLFFLLCLWFFGLEHLIELVLIKFRLLRLEEQLVDIPLARKLGETVSVAVRSEEEEFCIRRPEGLAFIVGGVGQKDFFPGIDFDGKDIRVAVAADDGSQIPAVGRPDKPVGKTSPEIVLGQQPVLRSIGLD